MWPLWTVRLVLLYFDRFASRAAANTMICFRLSGMVLPIHARQPIILNCAVRMVSTRHWEDRLILIYKDVLIRQCVLAFWAVSNQAQPAPWFNLIHLTNSLSLQSTLLPSQWRQEGLNNKKTHHPIRLHHWLWIHQQRNANYISMFESTSQKHEEMTTRLVGIVWRTRQSSASARQRVLYEITWINKDTYSLKVQKRVWISLGLSLHLYQLSGQSCTPIWRRILWTG